ncbi:hypothetical protein F3Y22_tig00110998pilonHSYRG00019 [Hibiscus syriacus]|uniref:Uncharacterized protein n=1 Tax=Hibiscus syriacus TaxID=106335 RepID=A0A6A2Z9E0_HIBSY|nr:hypothetical protein F3Y22_tig00110998pilonHSYRG00019 [Hibiscus syriacus]
MEFGEEDASQQVNDQSLENEDLNKDDKNRQLLDLNNDYATCDAIDVEHVDLVVAKIIKDVEDIIKGVVESLAEKAIVATVSVSPVPFTVVSISKSTSTRKNQKTTMKAKITAKKTHPTLTSPRKPH